MTNVVVNLRGTHGAGKSTVAVSILASWPSRELYLGGKLVGYRVDWRRKEPLYIVGPYRTACGGCDAIQPYDRIWPLVRGVALAGHHCLFEGALVSCSYGSIGEASELLPKSVKFVFATLDTPLETCIQRVNARRAANGKSPLEDTRNIEGKHKSVLSSHLRAFDRGRRVCGIHHEHAAQEVLALFGVKLTKEPR